MEECGRLRPRASEPLKQDVVVVAILVDVVLVLLMMIMMIMMMPWQSVTSSVPGLQSL